MIAREEAIRFGRTRVVATLVAILAGAPWLACDGGAPAVDANPSETVSADVGDDRPADAAGAGGAGGVGGASGAGGAADAGADGGDAAIETANRPDALGFDGRIVGADDMTCNGLENTAPYITPNVLAQDAQPPTLRGGTIVDGRYELVSVDYYPVTVTPSPHTLYHRTTQLQQGGTIWQWVELFPSRPGTPPDGSWMVVRRSMAVAATPDGTLAATSACGNVTGVDWRYETSPGAIVVWQPSDGIVARYAAAP